MSNSSMINKNQMSNSISSATDLIDAKLEQQQLCASKLCPGCGHMLQGSKPDWVGLPAGVKFDPTDQELIEHLEAKVEGKSSKSHPLIDEFIPTIEGEDGICYTHPKKLPGVTRDGLSRHYFHRPSRAYTTGTRKRRKIQMSESDEKRGNVGETRWHKTGKTRPVMDKTKLIKGCKKILVLYTNFGKNRKPEKTNWVMHQYHLGIQEEEKEGELVVSKIFYQTQPRHVCNWSNATTTTTTTATATSREGGGELSGSTCSSSKEVMVTTLDDPNSNSIEVGCAPLSSYGALDLHHLRQASDFSNFVSFGRSFDEANLGDVSTAMEVAAMTAPCNDHHLNQHYHHHHHDMNITQEHHHLHHGMTTNTNFHMNKPSDSISQIMSSSPLLDHHASIILDDGSFHVSTIMLQNESFQDQQQEQETEQQQHDKLGGRSASGLEEIIMSCNSSAAASTALKEESSITHTPDEGADQWLKYSPFWHDPDNPDHHG